MPRRALSRQTSAEEPSRQFATGSVRGSKNQLFSRVDQAMHLLIVLLQQLLGMLPGAKKVLQPEVVRQGTPSPTGSEPDACLRLARSNQGWMTISQALSVFWGQS